MSSPETTTRRNGATVRSFHRFLMAAVLAAVFGHAPTALAQDDDVATTESNSAEQESESLTDDERGKKMMAMMMEVGLCVDVVLQRQGSFGRPDRVGMDDRLSKVAIERCKELLEADDSLLVRMVVMTVKRECKHIQEVAPIARRVGDHRMTKQLDLWQIEQLLTAADDCGELAELDDEELVSRIRRDGFRLDRKWVAFGVEERVTVYEAALEPYAELDALQTEVGEIIQAQLAEGLIEQPEADDAFARGDVCMSLAKEELKSSFDYSEPADFTQARECLDILRADRIERTRQIEDERRESPWWLVLPVILVLLLGVGIALRVARATNDVELER